jgi:hypothetical protein
MILVLIYPLKLIEVDDIPPKSFMPMIHPDRYLLNLDLDKIVK